MRKEAGTPHKGQMSDNDNVLVDLNAEADAYGFLYGDIIRGTDVHHAINVLPPRQYWQGRMTLEGYEPHDTDWVLFLDGKEVARVREPICIEVAFTRALSKE